MNIAVLPNEMIKRIFRTLRWKWRPTGRQHKQHRKNKRGIAGWHRRMVWAIRIGLVLLALDIFYLTTIWPDWHRFKHGPIAKSAFIKHYQQQRRTDKTLPPLQWQPVPLADISLYIQRAVIVAEDARFYQHSGFDLIALKDAMDYNIERMSIKYGASTISQQVVKNMFFSASRDPLRKWHELIFTISMEFFVPKRRILSTYLNIAEFGAGVYGVEAAARHYWGISAKQLSEAQAVELAATLPSPRKSNPATRTPWFTAHAAKIARHLDQARGD